MNEDPAQSFPVRFLVHFVFFFVVLFLQINISHKEPQGKCKMQWLQQKELPKNKGNPLALTLGTTILLALCNFLIAQDKSTIIEYGL